MKRIIFIAGLLFTINTSFSAPIATEKAHRRSITTHYVVKKIKKSVPSCSATGTIGTGANKITFTATAPTCKEAIAMVQAALQ